MLFVINSAKASPIHSRPGAFERFSKGITTINLLALGSSAASGEAFVFSCWALKGNCNNKNMSRSNSEFRVRFKVDKL